MPNSRPTSFVWINLIDFADDLLFSNVDIIIRSFFLLLCQCWNRFPSNTFRSQNDSNRLSDSVFLGIRNLPLTERYIRGLGDEICFTYSLKPSSSASSKYTPGAPSHPSISGDPACHLALDRDAQVDLEQKPLPHPIESSPSTRQPDLDENRVEGYHVETSGARGA